MIINDLEITKDKKGWIVSDGKRSFTIDEQFEPSADWFCSYETIKQIVKELQPTPKVIKEEE